MTPFHCVNSVKYGVFSGHYFPVFSPNTGKYRPEKTPYIGHFSRSVFLKNHSQNLVKRLVWDTLSLDQQPKVLNSLFLLHIQVETYQNILLWTHIKFFFKKEKRGLELVSLSHFLHVFLKKHISHVIFYWPTKFRSLIVFASWDIGY